MSPREAPEKPDWLVVGAPVVCWSRGETDRGYTTKVRTVAKHTFTTEKYPSVRFDIRSMMTRGSGWSWTNVAPVDSENGQRVIAATKKRIALYDAEEAFQEFFRNPDMAHKERAVRAILRVPSGE